MLSHHLITHLVTSEWKAYTCESIPFSINSEEYRCRPFLRPREPSPHTHRPRPRSPCASRPPPRLLLLENPIGRRPRLAPCVFVPRRACVSPGPRSPPLTPPLSSGPPAPADRPREPGSRRPPLSARSLPPRPRPPPRPHIRPGGGGQHAPRPPLPMFFCFWCAVLMFFKNILIFKIHVNVHTRLLYSSLKLEVEIKNLAT